MLKKKPENLLKNLQNFSQKVTQSPTTLMPMPLLQQTLQGKKDKDGLHGWIIALEAPTLSHLYSKRVQVPSRFHSTLRKSIEIFTTVKNPRMQKSTDQEVSQGGKESGKESVLFNFGDAYCDGVNWVSIERTLYMENFKTIRSIPAVMDGLSSSISAIEDIKYSRDDVFKLSSQEETMKEFFREKIF